MGNAGSYRQAGNQPLQDPRNFFQADLPKFILQGRIGNGKFLKTYSVRVDGTPLVVKIYMKLPEEDLQAVALKLSMIWKLLSPSRYPNILPYEMWIKPAEKQQTTLRTQKVPTPTYLIRQYIYSNMHDRLSTRPFMNELEKLWLLYQLFRSVELAHSQRIFHGDIKPENCLCTTWNWLLLTDFGPFKPVYIPDDDPTDFQYFFDAMGRSSCYLAPERFYRREVSQRGAVAAGSAASSRGLLATPVNNNAPGGNSSGLPAGLEADPWDPALVGSSAGGVLQDRWATLAAMDIFSLGCTMAEIFLDGESFLDLPDMLQYLQATQTGKSSTEKIERFDQFECRSKSLLNKINNKLVRDVIIDMTQRVPEMRSSVQSYRYILEGRRSPSKMASLQGLTSSVVDSNHHRGSETSTGGHPSSSKALQAQLLAQQANSPFPPYFSKIIHPLFQKLHVRGVTPDDRIAILAENYGEVISCIIGIEDSDGAAFFKSAIRSIAGYQKSDKSAPSSGLQSSANAAKHGEEKRKEGDKDHTPILPERRDSLDPASARRAVDESEANRQFLKTVVGAARFRVTESDRSTLKPLLSPDVAFHIGSNSTALSEILTSSQESEPTEAALGEGESGAPKTNLQAMSLDELMAQCKELIESVERGIDTSSVAVAESITADNAFARMNLFDDLAGEAKPTNPSPHNGITTSADVINAAVKLSYGPDSVGVHTATEQLRNHNSSSLENDASLHTASAEILELHSVPANKISSEHRHLGVTLANRAAFEGILLPVQVICSCFRHVKFPQSKLVSLMLLVRFGIQCTDEVILHRVVPILVLAVEDPSAPIRAMAVRALRAVLQAVRSVNAIEANIFPQYIFPALSSKVARDPEFIVRIAFAESIGRLAETAKRFLDQTHLIAQNKAVAEMNATTGLAGDSGDSATGSQATLNIPSDSIADSSLPTASSSIHVVDFPYDAKLKALHEQVNRWIRDLVLDSGNAPDNAHRAMATSGYPVGPSGSSTDPRRVSMLMQHAISAGSAVKRVLLVDVMRLCVFFGQEATMDILLRYILTFLNDPDWELRYSFCAKIASVCAYIGPTVTTEYILPCVENALADVEERVIAKAIQCMASLLEMNLLSKFVVVDTVKNIIPLILHPCHSIREASIRLCEKAMSFLGAIDSLVFVLPLLQPVCRYEINFFDGLMSTEEFRLALRSSISRSSYRNALISRLDKIDASSSDISSLAQDKDAAVRVTSAVTFVPYSEPKIEAPREELISDFGIDPSALLSGDTKPPVESIAAEASTVATIDAVEPTILSSTAPIDNQIAPRLDTSIEFPVVQDIDDVAKLEIVGKYLDRVAQEILQKTIQQRNMMNNQQLAENSGLTSFRRRVASVSRSSHFTSIDSLLDVSATALPDHSAYSIFVPHQKYGVHLFPVNSSDRKVPISELLSTTKSVQKLRQAFGVITSQGDVARALAAGIHDQWENQLNNFGLGDSSSLPPPPARATTANRRLTQRDRSTAMSGEAGVMGGPAGPGSALMMNQTNTSASNGAGIASGAASAGISQSQISSAAFGNNVGYDAKALVRRIRALKVPPLPPDLGSLVQPDGDKKYNMYLEGLDLSATVDAGSRSSWRPKENVLVASLLEHTHSVNHIAVAADQSFFASVSSDKTVKIWKVRGLDKAAFPRSAFTYTGHRGSVLGACVLENSHSVASCSDDGSLHIWRVDGSFSRGGGESTPNGEPAAGSVAVPNAGMGSVGGATLPTQSSKSNKVTSTELKILKSDEGPIMAVNHFNSDTASIVTYITQQGGLYGHDLRSASDAFNFKIRPELGFLTSMTVSPDRNWVCVGTSRGYISLWDIRYNLMSKLWRHSSNGPIHRLACCKSLPRIPQQNYQSTGQQREFTLQSTEGAYLFVASGLNEAAVWGIPEGGECFKCFRTISPTAANDPIASLPFLRDVAIPRHPLAPIESAYTLASRDTLPGDSSSVRAIMGRISHTGTSYLVTAGTDANIRYWDFSSPSKCFTVSGLLPAQPRPILSTPTTSPEGSYGKLFLSHDSALPSAEAILQAQLPQREGRGAQLPSQGYKDAVLDLKSVDLPVRMMISAGRDGCIKLWR